MNWLAVFIGGGIGSLIRFSIAKIPFTMNFPLNTFITNTLACLILALTIYFIRPQTSFWQLFLFIGLCGGMSTFSTFSKETFDLFQSGNYIIAVVNILVSIGTCVGIFWVLKN
jgi:fluoride exporter